MSDTAQKYSLAHLTALGCPPPELVYVAARAGYDYVSIRPIFMGLEGEPNYELATNPTMLAQTKAAMAATGVGVHDIELARVAEGVDLAKYEAAFAVGAELGAKSVISSVWTPGRSFYIDLFGQICDLAAKYDLTVDLEFVPIAEVNTLDKAVDVLRAVNADNAGLMLDMYHTHRGHTDPRDLASLPREWFRFIHLCDAPAQIPADLVAMRTELREARLYPGEGGIPIKEYLAQLPEVVYSIELPHLARASEYGYAEHAARCIEHAKAYFAEDPA
jgi:sugar phosphate isomerase/epimerase